MSAVSAFGIERALFLNLFFIYTQVMIFGAFFFFRHSTCQRIKEFHFLSGASLSSSNISSELTLAMNLVD